MQVSKTRTERQFQEVFNHEQRQKQQQKERSQQRLAKLGIDPSILEVA